jgi:DNA-binding response OmpR family regulator
MAARGKILVVDDDDVVRGMVAYLFDDAGYTVSEASGGKDALAEVDANPPDCLVLDLMMPGVDGYAVLRAMRAKPLAPDMRVLILTAKSDPTDAVGCWELGADDYVTKPFDGEHLVATVGLLISLTTEEAHARRQAGLDAARKLAKMEAAFGRHKRR